MDNKKIKKAVVLLVLFAHALIGFSQTQPKPVLKLGGRVFEDGYIFNNDPFISLGNSDSSQIKLVYKILKWDLILNKMTYSGLGNILSEDVLTLINNEAQKNASFPIGLRIVYRDQRNELFSIEKKCDVQSLIYLTNTDEYKNLWNHSKLIVLEKAKDTEELFNESNPFSLVSLIRQNKIQDAYPMPISTSERLMALGQKILCFYMPYNFHPIIESDSMNPNYGFERIDEYGDFVYPKAQAFCYDLNSIDCIIIFLKDTDEIKPHMLTDTISHIAFCKKYGKNEKYEVVLSFPFHENLLNQGIISFQEATEFSTTEMINLQNKLAASKKVNYKAGGWSIHESCRIINFEKLVFDQLIRYEIYPPQKFSAQAIGFMPAFHYQAVPEVIKTFSNAFDSVNYETLIVDVPLTNQNGEDSVVVNEKGVSEFVYPVEYKINKIHLKTNFDYQNTTPIKVVFKYELKLNDKNELVFKPIEAIYCANNDSNSAWMVFASLDLTHLEGKNYSFIVDQKMEWINNLELAVKNGKPINLNSKRELKQIRKLYNINF
jgi:hypothetical protein